MTNTIFTSTISCSLYLTQESFHNSWLMTKSEETKNGREILATTNILCKMNHALTANLKTSSKQSELYRSSNIFQKTPIDLLDFCMMDIFQNLIEEFSR